MAGPECRILGVEGGATKTEWVLLERRGGGEELVDRGRLAASNFVLTPRGELERLLRQLPRDVGRVGVFLAGCGAEQRAELQALAAAVWPRAAVVVGSDRESGFAAAFGDGDGIVVIAGTGSTVHGRRGGRVEKAGGWGQLLGDRGSGFDIAVHGLRHCLRIHDVEGRTIPMARAFLRELGLNSLPALVEWAQGADKLAIARLSPIVFEAAVGEDAADVGIILDVAARRLAEFAGAVAHRLGFERPPVRLLGGVFSHHPLYVELFRANLERRVPGADVGPGLRPGCFGAARIAARARAGGRAAGHGGPAEDAAGGRGVVAGRGLRERLRALAEASTEQPNPRSANLDELDTAGLVDVFVDDAGTVAGALAARKPELGAAVELVHRTLAGGGRLFYFGAGTSGRLGVLDASEMPPTFGVSAELVQGVIAGGPEALWRAVEGAEDDAAAGAVAARERGVCGRDLACGITASGNTPFVEGALRWARGCGARTLLLSCNPARRREDPRWDVEIDLPTGPELITGSTRLRAGTATKLALNLISTCAMIRLGRVRGNLMVDLDVTNHKLRARAARIVSSLRGCSHAEATDLLERHRWNVRAALDAPRPGPQPPGAGAGRCGHRGSP